MGTPSESNSVIDALDLLTQGPAEVPSARRARAVPPDDTARRRLDDQLAATSGWRTPGADNVVGMGVARKRRGEVLEQDLSLVVYVREKVPLGNLGERERVPPALDLEGVPGRVITDVQAIGDISLEGFEAEVRPLRGGYSISGKKADTTGTLGCLVRSRDGSGRTFVLSNAHVLADSGLARKGAAIYQPGLADKAKHDSPVAKLHDWHRFTFGGPYSTQVDAAIAVIPESVVAQPSIAKIGIPKGVRAPKRGMKVQKSGRTTGHTTGEIQDIHFRTSMSYPKPGSEESDDVHFAGLVLCSRFTGPGDSGSLVLDMDGYAVGLHFCGTPTTSIFSPIDDVLDALGVDLVTA